MRNFLISLLRLVRHSVNTSSHAYLFLFFFFCSVSAVLYYVSFDVMLFVRDGREKDLELLMDAVPNCNR